MKKIILPLMLTASTLGRAQSYSVDSIAGSYLIPNLDTVTCMQSHPSGNLYYGTSGTGGNTASFSKVYTNSITEIVTNLSKISAMGLCRTSSGDSILFYNVGQPGFKRYSGTGTTLLAQNVYVTATAQINEMRSFNRSRNLCLVGGNYTYDAGAWLRNDVGTSILGLSNVQPFAGENLNAVSVCHDFTMETSDSIFSCGYFSGSFGSGSSGTTNIMLHDRSSTSLTTPIHTASGTVTEIEIYQNLLYYIVGNVLYRVPKAGGVATSIGSAMGLVNDLEVHGGKLFIGGSALVSYDGSAWTTIISSQDLDGTIQTLESHEGSLYLAGDFLSIMGDAHYRKICKIGVGSVPVIISDDIDNTVCLGSTINFTTSTNSVGSWNSCTWFGAQATWTETFNSLGTCDINFSGNTNLGFPVVANTVTITVISLPSVGAGTDQSVCEGESVVLNGSGAIGYTWDNGVTNGVAFNPVSSNTYTVTGIDANGCTNTDQVTIMTNPLPNVNAGADQSVCEGETVILNASGANSYSWNNGINNGAPFTPTSTTTYTVTGTDMNGCVDTDQATVTVNSNPVPIIEFQGGVLSPTNISTGTFQWIFNVTQVVSNDLTYTPTQNGSYTFYVVDINGCDGLSDPLVINNLGLSETEIAEYVTIKNGELIVKLDWSIYDMTGRVIASGKAGSVDMPVGIFFLVTEKFTKKYVGKIED